MQGRMFENEELSKRTDLADAFKTGKFTPEVIEYLNNHHIETLMGYLPKSTNFVTLSPDLLVLNQQKLAEIFRFLPQHVKVVNLLFADLERAQLARFKGLMAHAAYAKETSVFNLQWDFHRFDMKVLSNNIFAHAIPRQLTNVNFIHGPGIERVCDGDIEVFKKAKLANSTELHVDRTYHLRHRGC